MSTLVNCPWCNVRVVAGTTCPKSIPCPSCSAAAGRDCMRPSGHRAAELHADRVREAELNDYRKGIRLPGAAEPEEAVDANQLAFTPPA